MSADKAIRPPTGIWLVVLIAGLYTFTLPMLHWKFGAPGNPTIQSIFLVSALLTLFGPFALFHLFGGLRRPWKETIGMPLFALLAGFIVVQLALTVAFLAV